VSPSGIGYFNQYKLKTGLNYIPAEFKYLSTIQLEKKVVMDWFPTPKRSSEYKITIREEHKTNSTYSALGGIAPDIPLIKNIVKATVSVIANLTKSKEIADISEETIIVPSLQQARVRLIEKRKGYTFNIYKVTVTGDPVSASLQNGRLKYYVDCKVTGD
jgi:hypothetical protein